jgi:formylglycine-generating enzyme required for sulfatase activity
MVERVVSRVGALVVAAIVAGCATPPPSVAPSSASADAASPTGSASASAPAVPSSSPTASAARTLDPTAGIERTDKHGVSQEWVPPGTFLMGTDETDPTGELAPPDWARFELAAERPQHEVSISTGFWIDETEVTNEAYQAFVNDGGYTTPALWSDEGREWLSTVDASALPVACVDAEPTHPRVCITWYEAEAYAAWRGGVLPSEAQWEYAARGPSSVIFPWGDAWDPAKANVVESTELTPVGSYPEGASWVKAHDMAGNAMEWVADWYSGSYYKQEVRNDPTGPELGSKKVEKGGWWGAVPYVARSAYRHFEDPPTYQDHHIGVRVVSLGDPPV